MNNLNKKIMATYVPGTVENGKENSRDMINVDNSTEQFCGNTDLDKKDSYHERTTFYKKPIKKGNYKLEVDFNETPQEIRRQRILYYQKKNRDAAFNAGRGLLEEVLNSENEEEMDMEEKEDDAEEMEVELNKRRSYKMRKDYARMFMLSEWMLEIPQDFAEKWVMVPCPIGKRVLIVACKGVTRMYTRKGQQISSFKSFLPGGCRNTCKSNCTILDCVWLQNKGVCYVLDVLLWANQEMINCEAEFRFYWLKSQFDDISELKNQITGINDYPLLLLPTVTCDNDFYKCLESISTTLTLDGLLFYHKEAHYTSGRTPLVAWLKTYMLPEVLGMTVPEPYDKRPDSYIDFEHHVLKVVQMEKKRIENMQNRKKLNKFEQEDME